MYKARKVGGHIFVSWRYLYDLLIGFLNCSDYVTWYIIFILLRLYVKRMFFHIWQEHLAGKESVVEEVKKENLVKEVHKVLREDQVNNSENIVYTM